MSAGKALLPLLLLTSPFAGAATIAHWKFDTGSPFVDSAGTNTLTNNNPTTTFTGGSANFTGGGSGGQLLSAPNVAAWTDTSFTVEAFFTPTTLNTSGPSTIVAHLGDTGGRQWLFGVDLNGNLTALLRHDGTTENYYINATSLPKIVNGQSYYVAAAIDLTDSVAANRITLYVQNLTTGGPLVSANTATSPAATLGASTAPLTIGSTGHSSSRMNGSISEIRISDTKLTAGDLLIPEPAGALLCAAGLIPLLRRRR